MIPGVVGSAVGPANAPTETITKAFGLVEYVGNGSTLGVVNGVDMVNQNSLTFLRPSRSGGSTQKGGWWAKGRGGNDFLQVDGSPLTFVSTPGGMSFNSDGFTVANTTHNNVNSRSYIALTFAHVAGLCAVIDYVGDGTGARAIAHGLGEKPVLAFVFRTSSNRTPYLWGSPMTDGTELNLASTSLPSSGSEVVASSSTVTVPSGGNTSGETYTLVAIKGHADIAVGSYTGTGASQKLTLPFQPGVVIMKTLTGAVDHWGYAAYPLEDYSGTNDSLIYLNRVDQFAQDWFDMQSDGIQIKSTFVTSGRNYLYIALSQSAVEP